MIGILAPLPVARSGYRGAAAFRECSMKFNLMVSSARERRTISHSSEFHRRTSHPLSSMPLAKVRALTILGALDEARSEPVGKAVILTDGKAGPWSRSGLTSITVCESRSGATMASGPSLPSNLRRARPFARIIFPAANSGDSIPFAAYPLFENLTEWDCTNEDHRPVICLRVDRMQWRPA